MEEYDDEGLTCHTAPGVVFTTMDDLKEHYRSDWHRYNLKRKVRSSLRGGVSHDSGAGGWTTHADTRTV